VPVPLTNTARAQISFASGEVFVHSDVVYEIASGTGEQFGIDRPRTLVATGSCARSRDSVETGCSKMM
jgi:hypothetical protein